MLKVVLCESVYPFSCHFVEAKKDGRWLAYNLLSGDLTIAGYEKPPPLVAIARTPILLRLLTSVVE